jgi:hypothetical protein
VNSLLFSLLFKDSLPQLSYSRFTYGAVSEGRTTVISASGLIAWTSHKQG